jgi:hypothetical protein
MNALQTGPTRLEAGVYSLGTSGRRNAMQTGPTRLEAGVYASRSANDELSGVFEISVPRRRTTLTG